MAVTYTSNMPLWNWNNEIVETPTQIARVSTSADIAEAIRDAERGWAELRPSGSRWSFTRASFTSDTMLLMKDLDGILFVQKGERTVHGRGSVLKDGVHNQGRNFVHVESGATIERLYRTLSLPHIDLSLATAGGGSTGQTIGGFISTGSHGGDFDQGSILDWVRALHIVVAGGRHLWIERTAPNDITSDSRLRQSTSWQAGMRTIRDDEVFYAALVACGRMGVLSSVIIEVVDGFHLRDKRVLLAEPMVRPWLGRPVSQLFDNVQSVMGFSQRPYFASIDFALDPESPFAYLHGREKTVATPMTPKYDLQHDIADDLLFHHSDWIGILNPPSQIGSKLNGHSSEDIRALQNFVFNKRFQPFEFRGPAWYVMFGADIGLRVISAEYAFDATTTRYVDFIDAIRSLADAPFIPGLVSLRYLPRSPALLAIQQWDETVHAEIAVPVGYEHAERYFQQVDDVAQAHGGAPHWGQFHMADAHRIRRVYGDNLSRWRKVLHSVSQNSMTFSNEFTRQRGLEPVLRDSLLLLA